MLTSLTTQTVRTARPRYQKRHGLQSCQILYEKVLMESKSFSRLIDRDQADKEAKAILDRKDGDNKNNRLAMLRLWMDARKWVADEASQAAKKTRALAEAEALIAPVVDGWKAANEAWIKSVQAEKANGHDGQKAVANAFWSEFAHFEPLVLKPRGTEEAVAELATKLEDLTFRVGNFVCEAKPAKRHVAKPGSASKRHKGGAKKAQKRANAEASAGKSQGHEDGALKSIRKHEKEVREQGGHPEKENKNKKKDGKKK